jgi:hypothetical protein
LKRHSQKSLPASLFKGRRAFLNAFDKRFRFFPPVEWRQAYSTGGRKGDLTDFQRAKGLLIQANYFILPPTLPSPSRGEGVKKLGKKSLDIVI